MKTKRMVTDAILIAMYAVMSTFLTLNLGGMNISVGSLPIIVGAVLFGPADGLIIGLLGSFLNQMFSYGLTPTTVLWLIPAAASGFVIGYFAKHRNFNMATGQTVFITVISSLVVTALNTVVMYADAKIWGYYTYAYVFGKIIPRIFSGIITAVILGVLVSRLIKPLKSALSGKG